MAGPQGATARPFEGRWKALQTSGICERRAYLTEVYRNALGREVRSLGYEIDNRSLDVSERFTERGQSAGRFWSTPRNTFSNALPSPPTTNCGRRLKNCVRAEQFRGCSGPVFVR